MLERVFGAVAELQVRQQDRPTARSSAVIAKPMGLHSPTGAGGECCLALQLSQRHRRAVEAALVPAVGDDKASEKGRDLAARLQLTPRENSPGGRQRLEGISKGPNRYVRTMLVYSARAGLENLAKHRGKACPALHGRLSALQL